MIEIEFFVPSKKLSNAQVQHGKWTAEAIEKTLGISNRYVAGHDEYALDLARMAIERLLRCTDKKKEDIDYLLVCTQSPDYLVPTNACVLQNQVGLGTAIGALDFNLGCSGYVYGLSLAKGLLDSGQASNVLLVTAETYSKYINEEDYANRMLFGDAATATLIDKDLSTRIVASKFGTDGSGYDALIVPDAGLRPHSTEHKSKTADRTGTVKRSGYLHMDGGRIMNFALHRIPFLIEDLLKKVGINKSEIDHFVLHQANAFVLEQLRIKCDIPADKLHICSRDFGNTVSNTIPIALSELQKAAVIKAGDRVMLIGFGVGLSWGGMIVEW